LLFEQRRGGLGFVPKAVFGNDAFQLLEAVLFGF
jgi:hypothetical protein